MTTKQETNQLVLDILNSFGLILTQLEDNSYSAKLTMAIRAFRSTMEQMLDQCPGGRAASPDLNSPESQLHLAAAREDLKEVLEDVGASLDLRGAAYEALLEYHFSPHLYAPKPIYRGYTGLFCLVHAIGEEARAQREHKKELYPYRLPTRVEALRRIENAWQHFDGQDEELLAEARHLCGVMSNKVCNGKFAVAMIGGEQRLSQIERACRKKAGVSNPNQTPVMTAIITMIDRIRKEGYRIE